MCARYTLKHSANQVAIRFDVAEVHEALAEQDSIFPTQQVAVVTEKAGARYLEACRWGLIPSWAEDMKIGSRLINARAETLAEKPAFRGALAKRRCLIPADGYFEWKHEGRAKLPFYFHRKDNEIFAFAGLWEEWRGPDGPVRSVTLITTTPNEIAAAVHDRMPAILLPEHEAIWLDPSIPVGSGLFSMLEPYPVEMMEADPIAPAASSAPSVQTLLDL